MSKRGYNAEVKYKKYMKNQIPELIIEPLLKIPKFDEKELRRVLEPLSEA